MTKIGVFQKGQRSGYLGTITTLTLTAHTIEIRPAAKTDDKGPDFRIYKGSADLGAAWKKVTREGKEYLSVKLDDPSFPAPIYASLLEGEGGFSLVWSRDRNR